MEMPNYLKTLWRYKWLLVVGAVVAVAAALLAGFTVKDGQLSLRAITTYTASTTVLVGSDDTPLFQAQIPGQKLQQGQTAPQNQDLSSTAVVYAYLVSGSQIKHAVVSSIGPLHEGETITAVRRTTQPGGNEAFPGRLSLPILDVVGTSDDPARSEKISRAATTAFLAYAAAQQETQKIAPDQRVQLTTINTGPAVAGDTSNPAIPIVITGLGVFAVFVALAFVLNAISVSRAQRKTAKARRRAKASPDTDRAPAQSGQGIPEAALPSPVLESAMATSEN